MGVICGHLGTSEAGVGKPPSDGSSPTVGGGGWVDKKIKFSLVGVGGGGYFKVVVVGEWWVGGGFFS